MKITQLGDIRRVLGIVSSILVVTLVAVALVYWPRAPRSGQGKSPTGDLHPPGQWYAYTTNYPTGYDSAGFDFFSRFDYMRAFEFPSKGHTHEWDGERFGVRFDAHKNVLRVMADRNRDLSFRIDELLSALKAGGHHRVSAGPSTLDQKYLTLDTTIGRMSARFYIEDVTALENDKKWDVYHLQGILLVRAR